FSNLVDNGKTILMVTHDRELASRVSRTITIADGRIADGEQEQAVLASMDRQPAPARNSVGNAAPTRAAVMEAPEYVEAPEYDGAHG
ncbi:MAG: hypothetical protein KDE54_36170, partial [Caldilineaceae bacterium]|nr:hypothetical protein [Caldilineaceae bacterium]